jgi:hypothetical protein
MKVDRSLMQGVSPAEDGEMELMVRNLDIEPGMKTFEMGCNNPVNKCLTYTLQRMGLEAWSCDPSGCDAPIEHMYKQKFQDCTLPENYFDRVLDVSAMHHFCYYGAMVNGVATRIVLPDQDIATAKKVYTILKPGGSFDISFDQFSNVYVEDNDGTRRYTYDKVKERLAEPAGFNIARAQGYKGDQSLSNVDWNDASIQFAYFQLIKP